METIEVEHTTEIPHKFTGIVILKNWLTHQKIWCLNGKLHRLDGPAVIYIEGFKEKEEEYLILNKPLTKEEFESFRAMWESTLQKKTQKLMKAFVKLVKVK